MTKRAKHIVFNPFTGEYDGMLSKADNDHIRRFFNIAIKEGRPICGARLPNGEVCTALPVEGKNRCAHHDYTRTKSPTYAIVHGLRSLGFTRCHRCQYADWCALKRDYDPDDITSDICAYEEEIFHRVMEHAGILSEEDALSNILFIQLAMQLIRGFRANLAVTRHGMTYTEEIYDMRGRVVGHRRVVNPMLDIIDRIDGRILQYLKEAQATPKEQKRERREQQSLPKSLIVGILSGAATNTTHNDDPTSENSGTGA